MLAMDDTNSTLTQAVSHPSEDTRSYLVLLEVLVRQWEIPLTLYGNRHASFKYNSHLGPVIYKSTQFARVMGSWASSRYSPCHPRPKAV